MSWTPAPPPAAVACSSCMLICMASIRAGSSSSSPTAGVAAAASPPPSPVWSPMDSAKARWSNASSSIIIGSSPPLAAVAAGVGAPPRVAAGVMVTASAPPSTASPPSPPSVVAAACASCRARSSSSDTRSASMRAGSSPPSMPVSKPCIAAWLAPAAAAAAKPLPPPAPDSPSWKIGVLSKTSARTIPGGTDTRLLLLFLLTAVMNASSFSALTSMSPKLTTSTATLHLRSFLPTETSAAASSGMGLPMNNTMRIRWCLFWRCLSARCATCTPVGKLMLPAMVMPCTELSTCPRSSVGVTSTRGTLPARLSTPTLFSGLDWVLAPASKFTASASACKRVGR
mmetsp:Transcript_17931/g.44439  ORF Transcript_17931/g.44439 Transcript_17931/m.44439 type:complete len:342 (-) Transcript_17931:126-1151(-)